MRDPFWAAHRTHFYQRATDNGFSVSRVVMEVFAFNVGLAALAMISVATGSVIADLVSLGLGAFAISIALLHFSRKRAS